MDDEDSPQEEKIWDSDEGLFVVREEKNEKGFCTVCGRPNPQPLRFKPIWYCHTCRKDNMEEVMKIAKAYKLLNLELDEENEQKRRNLNGERLKVGISGTGVVGKE